MKLSVEQMSLQYAGNYRKVAHFYAINYHESMALTEKMFPFAT